MALSDLTRNRLGFIVLGLTNNFAYVIMLSAAYDLLKSTSSPTNEPNGNSATTPTTPQSSLMPPINATNQQIDNAEQHYCNEHSTSTILLADTLPSLTTKIIYPFLLVGIPNAGKASATAFLSAISFIITGLSKSQVMIFVGVVCASFSSGLGESCFLSSTPQYGDVSLYGWSMGTGAAGLLGAISYALLRMVLPVEPIMMIMLVVPVAMMFAFFQVIKPIDENSENPIGTSHIGGALPSLADENNEASLSIISRGVDSQQREGISLLRSYGSQEATTNAAQQQQQQQQTIDSSQDKSLDNTPFDFHAKLRCLPSLAKYFLPLLLVYFAEYFINQGLFELVYYPEISFLNHAAQYRWFQVSYQLGVMISRSSLDCIQIKNLWLMSILQAVNAIIFLLHAMKAIHIPSFYIVIALIIYEGLLGGFTYVNTFYRIKKEVRAERKEFCISTVTIADSLGIVMAGLVALPVHNALCKLYS